MTVLLFLARPAQSDRVQHRHVVAHDRGFANHDGMGVVDHDPLADRRGGVDIDAKNLAHAHLHEIGQIPFTLFPQVMAHTVGLHGLIAFEIQDRLQQPVAGGVTLVNRHQIGTCRLDQVGITGKGLLHHLMDHHHRHFIRGQLCRDTVG